MITEIVELEINNGISDNEFISISDDLENKFHMNLEGYVSSELFKVKENNWTFIMHWESKEHFKVASKLINTSEETTFFMSCLKSVKIKTYEQIKAWKKL